MISIIIPVYNEEIAIKKVLETLTYAEDLEVIVVDGGSSDRTAEFANQYPVKVIECEKNRAVQMNEGAKQSRGEILLFLHADCLAENGSLKEIAQALNNGYIGGCLSQKIDSSRLIYRFIEKSGNMRARLFRIFYGDQAIFVHRDVFFKLGGFDAVPLFEDILFSRKMRKEGKAVILPKAVYASSRRWEKRGIIKTTFIYWLLTLGLHFNIPFSKLKSMYDEVR